MHPFDRRPPRRVARRALTLLTLVVLAMPTPGATAATGGSPAVPGEPSILLGPHGQPGSGHGGPARQSGCEGSSADDEATSTASTRIDPPGSAIDTTAPGGRPRAVPAARAPAAECGWIVRFRKSAKARDVARTVPAKGVDRMFRSAVHGFAARLDATQVARLRADPAIESVTPDWIATIADSEPATSWGLDRVDQPGLPLSGTFDFDPSGGAGVKAYVVDTGIRATHQDFGGRVSAGANFATDGSGTDDCNGHGTHVAGTIGGASFGIARAVTLVPVRVLNCGGSAPYSWIIAGLDWVIADHAPGEPAVANLSIGGPLDPGLNAAIQATIDDGVVLVVAAGNSNADACGFSPASAPQAITVGASDATDRMAGFSNHGSCVDLFGPGVAIVSAGIASDSASAIMSGTSMASPHVTGIAAVLAGRNPDASPATIAAGILAESDVNLLGDTAGSPDRLAHLGPPVPGPQVVGFALSPLYLSEPPTGLDGMSTSGETPTFASLTMAVCTVSGAMVSALATGTCTIRASVTGGAGWNATHTDESTTVYVHRQLVAVDPWAEFAWQATNAPGASATSGLAVTYTPVSTPCTVEGALLRGVEVGDCLVVAHQAGNAIYGPAEPVFFTRSVVPARQTLSGPAAVQIPFGGSAAWAGSSTAGLPVDVLSATPGICTPGPGVVAGLATGACHLRLTQPGSPGVRASGSTTLTAVSATTPWYTRIAIRPDGRPVVAFADGGHLRLASCADASCSDATETTLVDLADRYSSFPVAPDLIVIDLAVVVAAGDRPVIFYSETAPRPKPGNPDDLDYIARVLVCADPACTAWTDRIVEDPDPLADLQVNAVAAIASPTGVPILAYSGDNFGLRMYLCSTVACTGGIQRDIASPPDGYGLNPSLALDAAGRPVIGYLQSAAVEWSTPTIARCGDATCSTVTRTTVGEASRWYKPAVVVPADDRPMLFWTQDVTVHDVDRYLDYRVMRGRCDDPACTTISSGILDDTGVLEANGTQNTWSVAGFDVSAALGPDGRARVGYLAWVRRVPSVWQTWGGTPWTAIVTSCGDADCAITHRSYLDEWSRTGGWIHRSTLLPLEVGGDGTLVTTLGFFPSAYSSADPLAVGVKVATCADAVCGTAVAAQVVAPRTLSVVRSGSGSGTVTSTPAGIACGATCSAPFGEGSTVTLQATPGVASAFSGWSGGGCSGTGGCTVTMTTATSVTATFRETQPPLVTAPVTAFRTGTPLVGASLPVQVTWSGSDAGSGIARYELSRTTTGGLAWSVISTSLTAPTLATIIASSGAARFRVRAVDQAGNTSAWTYGPTLTARLVQQTSTAIHWSTGWTTVSSPLFAGGSARASSTPGRVAAFTTTGRSVALVTDVGSARGKLRVYVNGTYVTTVDLGAATRYRVVVWQRTWSTTATRSIRLVVDGTTTRPRIDIDAFGVLQAS